MFGFQKDNVANQREHLILLLANLHIRQCPNPDQQLKLDDNTPRDVMKRLFKNYKKWCKYLGCKSCLWLPAIQQEVQQRQLLYMGLYLLIWGEAANLRFMPECICYIFHHMASELHGMLAGNVSPTTGEHIKPAYGGDDEAVLRKVVTPIYDTVAKEAKRSRDGKSKHSQWRNYDDLNEYFWSADCFRLGWPMHADADFFCVPPEEFRNDKHQPCLHSNPNSISSQIKASIPKPLKFRLQFKPQSLSLTVLQLLKYVAIVVSTSILQLFDFMAERDAAIKGKLASVKDLWPDVKRVEEQAPTVMCATRAEIRAVLKKMKETVDEVETREDA